MLSTSNQTQCGVASTSGATSAQAMWLSVPVRSDVRLGCCAASGSSAESKSMSAPHLFLSVLKVAPRAMRMLPAEMSRCSRPQLRRCAMVMAVTQMAAHSAGYPSLGLYGSPTYIISVRFSTRAVYVSVAAAAVTGAKSVVTSSGGAAAMLGQ